MLSRETRNAQCGIRSPECGFDGLAVNRGLGCTAALQFRISQSQILNSAAVVLERAMGLEPTTIGLEGRSSAN